jgi:hypothetical protein
VPTIAGGSDAGLIALAERCTAARRARNEAIDRLEAAMVGRPALALDTDANLRALDAAHQEAADEFDAMAFVLFWAPATTLDGALAKRRALDGDDVQPERRGIAISGRLNTGDQRLTTHVVAALRCLQEGR